MKILMVLESDFPPDVRVENEIKSLTRDGHIIHLACTTLKNHPVKEQWDKTVIHRKPINRFVYKSSVGALKLPFYFNFWRKYLNGLFEKNNFDIIHIHDLPLIRIGTEIKLRYKIPMIVDLHENWPGLLRMSTHTKTLAGRLLCSIRQWEAYEREYIRHADRIIVVVEEAKERIMKLSVSEKKICIVSNTVDITDIEPDHKEDIKKSPGKTIFIYEGGITFHRGIQYFLAALSEIRPLSGEVEFRIVGNGSYLKDLRQLTHQMDLDHIVRFYGWQPMEIVFELLSNADFAVIPHIKSPHTDTTVPHKLFNYMYSGLPILASNCDPVERIIKETSSGYIYQYDNIAELADIIKMLLTRELQIPTEGKKWVVRKYNWLNEEKQLLNIYKELNSNISCL